MMKRSINDKQPQRSKLGTFVACNRLVKGS